MNPPRPAPLRWTSVLGYGAGDIANNFVFAMGTFFLLSYYTDVAGLPLVAVGSLLMIVKIYGAGVDLLAGRIIDQHSSRWGRFRPFILCGAVPLLVLNVAVFSVPESLSPSGKLLYAYLSYALLVTAYAFVNMAYGSLACVMTQDPVDRARLGAARTVMSVMTGSVLTILIGPSLAGLQGGVLQARLTGLTVAEAVLGTLLFATCFLSTAEVVPRTSPPPSLRGGLRAVIRNRALLVLCGTMVFALLGYTCSGASLVYFARHLSPDPKQFFLFIGVLGLVSAAVSFAGVPALVRRFDKRQVALAGLLLCCLGYLLLFFATRARSEVLVVCAFALSSLGVRAVMSTVWALEADTVEYGEWRTGVRIEGLTYATFSVSRKIGQALGAGCPAMLLALGGYRNGEAAQSAAAIDAIVQSVALVPALAVLMAFGLLCLYPLTDRRFAEIVSEVRRRQAAVAVE